MQSLVRRRNSSRKARRNPGRSFCDLSNNNSFGRFEVYNAAAYARKHPFLIHKASESTHFVDGAHAERCESTHVQGIPVGHYHFMEGFTTPFKAIEEAEHFYKVIKPHFWVPKHGHTDFVILDIETHQTVPNEVITAFQNRLDWLLKRELICYTGLDYFFEHNLVCRSKKWWLAAYPGPLPFRLPRNQKIWAHQFTDKGACEGVAGPGIDMSLLIDKPSIQYWTK